MNPIIPHLRSCSRCTLDHFKLEAIPFTHQPYLDVAKRKYHFTHFAICPMTLEPILMRLQDNPGNNDPFVMD